MAIIASEEDWFPLIGVVRLPPMPGFDGTPGLEEVIDFAIEEVLTLEQAGFFGALIENAGDRPSPTVVSEGYVHNLARVVQVVKDITNIKVGVGIINDPHGSLRAGYASRADFVRIRSSACESQDCVLGIQRAFEQIQELRKRDINPLPQKILVELDAPASSNIEPGSFDDKKRLLEICGPDALVLSTCVPELAPTIKQYRTLRRSCDERPVFVGSGFTPATLSRLCGLFSGALVDSAVQIDGRFDAEMCRRLVAGVDGFARVAI